MNQACFSQNTNLHEQNQHASSIQPIKINFVRMKYYFLLACCIGFFNLAMAQVDSTRSDTTRIVLGKKEIKIIDSEQGTDIKVREKDDIQNDSCIAKKESHTDYHFKKRNKRDGGFKGHWDAIEFGTSGFLNKDRETSLTGTDNFMNLNTNPTKSSNISLNFCQIDQGIFGNSFGMVTGLRFEFNNYFFDNNNSIIKNKDGYISSKYYTNNLDTFQLDKSKLSTLYFTIPLLFEFQFPTSRSFHKRLWISGGVLGSIKLDSHTKVVYKDNGERKKVKNHDDFNINVLRYGFTGRVGYNDFFAYANYYPVQFFEKNKGPELYTYSVGVGMHLD
jgi:hypothetical protein